MKTEKMMLADELRAAIEEGGGEVNNLLARGSAALERKDKALVLIEGLLDCGATTEQWAVDALDVVRAALAAGQESGS